MAVATICSDFGAQENKSVTVSHLFAMKRLGPDAMILVFLMLNFKPVFPLCSFTFIKRLFHSSSLSAIRVVSSAYLRLLIFLPASPGGSDGKESACNAGDLGLIPGLGKIPWKREQLSTPVFWPGEFHGLYSPWGGKESDMTEKLSLHFNLDSSLCFIQPGIFYVVVCIQVK